MNKLLTVYIAVEVQRDEARKEGIMERNKLEDVLNEKDGYRSSVLALQSTIKRLESDREDLVKCLEEARKRIAGTSIHSSPR